MKAAFSQSAIRLKEKMSKSEGRIKDDLVIEAKNVKGEFIFERSI